MRLGIPMRNETPWSMSFRATFRYFAQENNVKPVYKRNLNERIRAFRSVQEHLPQRVLITTRERYSNIPASLRRRVPISPRNITWSLTIVRSLIHVVEEKNTNWVGMRFRPPLLIALALALNYPP